MTDSNSGAESLSEFRVRAESWLDGGLPLVSEPPVEHRELQQRIYDAGFGGLPFPEEYGGAGLTLEHQKVFFEAAHAHERQLPSSYMVSVGILGPTLLDHGSHEIKTRFLPPLLRGDEVWIQLLSEPQGGSDMAGATTRITTDGDSYVVNGSKMWSTMAHHADFGLCLCRSDWEAPKHRGLSMVVMPLKDASGVSIEQIRSADGQLGDFCQEFFDDTVVPAWYLLGEENQGWPVAQTLLGHERNAVGNVGYGYGYNMPGARGGQTSILPEPAELASVARQRGVGTAVATRIAEAYIEAQVGSLTSRRIRNGLRMGTHQGQWGSLLKLQSSVANHESVRTALRVLGADALVWEGDEVAYDNPGTEWVIARGGTIGGGTNEMQRNIVSERLLGLPREPATDRDRPFNEVLRNAGRGT